MTFVTRNETSEPTVPTTQSSDASVNAINSGKGINQPIYVVDTGASFHVIRLDDCTAEERKSLRRANKRPLNTANGKVYVDWMITNYVETLEIWVHSYVLHDAPPVLSLGQLCREHGFKYEWDGTAPPTLRNKSSGKLFKCSEHFNVPYICPVHVPLTEKTETTHSSTEHFNISDYP